MSKLDMFILCLILTVAHVRPCRKLVFTPLFPGPPLRLQTSLWRFEC